jgi:hypothetical protein
MKQKKILVIDRCSQCKYLSGYTYPTCILSNKVLINQIWKSIPKWCKLEDKK